MTADQTIARDETAAKSTARRDVAGLAQRFVALSFCRADLLFELDSSQHIIFSAGTTSELFGKTDQDLFGKPFTEFLAEKDRQWVSDLLMTADRDGRIDDIAVQLPLKNGSTCEAVISGYRVPDFDYNFFLAVKVAPKRRVGARPSLADRDPESGTLNEKGFTNAAADRIRTISEAGGNAKMTLVNINNLGKSRMGMSEGAHSRMVGAIGDILNTHSAGGNTAGRIDDDHFGIVHTGDVDPDSMNAEIEAAAKNMAPEGVQITSQSQTIDADAQELTEDQIAKAIQYTIRAYTENASIPDPANLNGLFETMMKETMTQVDAFRQICLTRNFDLHYMPICNLKTGVIHHLEALTRFRGEASASGSPYKLITLAEEIGIINDFDLAVARKAVDTVKKHVATAAIPPIAINVSGHSISDDHFVKELRELLRMATNLSKMISLEITESAEITDFDRVNANIQQFRERGFHVALDDFGAGAASFDYLNSFDIDVVKFDGPVVLRAYQTAKGKAFLASMATLCRETGIETIAEMVEDQPLAKFLAECGIDNGQGWFFGKPGPDPEAFVGLKVKV